MFEDLIRELRRLEGTQQIPVPIEADEEGYFDRECPSEECVFQFKIHGDDWREKVRDEEVFCPFCGHTADSGSWMTRDQAEHAKKAAIAHVQKRLGSAMKRDADRWNRRQRRNSFISMTLKVDSRPRHVPLPLAAAEPMRLKIGCPDCACRYAVIGTAFFCPACGHNAAELVFTQSLGGIRNVLDSIETVRAAIPDKDAAETTIRLLVENGLQNAVTAFQRYAEALFSLHPSAPQPRRNAFQNLTEGSDLWYGAFGNRFDAHLATTELSKLGRAFQQWHLLAHTAGLVDQNYIMRSGDTGYRIGQRIVVRVALVREFLDLIEELANGLAADVSGNAQHRAR